jgi:hypothetical protein
MHKHFWRVFLPALSLLLSACTAGAPTTQPESATADNPTRQAILPTPIAPAGSDDVIVLVDAALASHPISPLIYGVSAANSEVLADLRPTVNSWGGNPNSRYNWEHGTAWNAARDWFYMNVDYTEGAGGSASDRHIEASTNNNAEVRMALPTLGWVARDNNNATCSFPNPDGSCGNAELVTCNEPGPIADPNRTSIPSDVASIRRWVQHMVTQDYQVRFFAMDNEPELWGETHYDVHPTCTTYQEILDQYLSYATMVRDVAPDSELLGPVTCCWQYYWNSPAGVSDKLRHGNQDFLPWFLTQVRRHDEQNQTRTIDVLDIHYYPEGVFRGGDDPASMAHRLRAPRSLWDPAYVDESWINQPVKLIPRLKQVIDQNYPGLKLGITEWNFGAEEHIGGALAVADVLGIFGREDVYLANYWTYPPVGSPSYLAFKLYTNFDGQGGRFGDRSVATSTSNLDAVTAYSALDSASGNLHLMLINKDPLRPHNARLDLRNVSTNGAATLYRLSSDAVERITNELFDLRERDSLTLPPYSITLMVLQRSE